MLARLHVSIAWLVFLGHAHWLTGRREWSVGVLRAARAVMLWM
jgi:hypothetical protein